MDEDDFNASDPHFAKFPGHVWFLQKLNEAKETAAKNRSRVYVNWRGYRAFVTPGKKKLEKADFMRHLIVALKAVKYISKEEEQASLNVDVIFVFKINCAALYLTDVRSYIIFFVEN